MLESIIDNVVQLKIFIAVAVVGGLLLGLIMYLTCRSFSWQGKNRKLIGFLFQMNWWNTIGLASSIVKCFLFLSILIGMGGVERIHIYTYVLLEVFYLIHRRCLTGLSTDILLGAVSVGMMVIMNMLSHYLAEIVFDKRILCILLMMAVVLVLLSLYDLVHCCSYIMKKERKHVGDEAQIEE